MTDSNGNAAIAQSNAPQGWDVPPLDLRLGQVHSWLASQGGRELHRTVREVEALETWTADGPETVQAAVEQLGRALTAAVRRSGPEALQRLLDPAIRDELRKALAYLRVGRRLRTLAWISASSPQNPVDSGHLTGIDTVSALLLPDPTGDDLAELAAQTIRACVRQVNRRVRLETIFGEERARFLLLVVTNMHAEGSGDPFGDDEDAIQDEETH